MVRSMVAAFYNRLPGRLAESLATNDLSRRALRRIVPNQDVVIRTGAGRDLLFNCGRANPAYALGDNELVVQEIFRAHLQPGDVFLDIGANVGFFSVIGARLVGLGGHVYAFEPVPANAAAVRHNVALNHFANVTVIDSAVADRPGKGELLVAHYAGGSALSNIGTPPPDLKEKIAVEIVSIDNLLATGVIRRPDVVKVDVEGAELAVLRGMVETMRQHRPTILYEIDDERAAEFERKSMACAQFLGESGYQVEPLAESYASIDWHVGHYLATNKGVRSAADDPCE